jgi:hypothetical protein
MNEQTPEHINKMDWRINNLTLATIPFVRPDSSNPMSTVGAEVEGAIVRYGEESFGLMIPNTTALFLNLSHICYLQAEQLVNKCVLNKRVGHLPDSDVFEFYEQMMASIVFAYTSLESFVNEELPDDYIHIVENKNNRCTEHYNKEQIERYLSLDTKLRDVLPAVLQIQSPKGTKIWQDFNELKNIRDRIIHIKTSDRNFGGYDDKSIWNVILSKPLIKTYDTAKNMMYYFLKPKNKTPRWFDKCPF